MSLRRIRPLSLTALAVVIVVVLGITFLTRLGQRTEMVFSEINQGLNPGEGRAMSPLPTAAPFAAAPQALEELEYAADSSGAVGDVVQQNQPGDGIERMIIKNADLSLQVANVREAEAAVRTQVAALGGYIVRVEMNGTDEQMTAYMTFRVPAERFDDALTGVQGLAEKVLSRTIGGDDVTEEFVDLDARLRNLEATRDRLRALLDRANRVEDALQVDEALSRVQGEIESIRGRMQYLQQSAALSTVNVYLSPVPVVPIVTAGAWQPVGVAREALRNLIELGQGLVNLAIVLLVWTPVWLSLLLLGRWGWRRLRRPQGPGAGPTTPTTA